MGKNDKNTVENVEVEAQAKAQAEVSTISLEDYLKEVKVHQGLLASFKYEAQFNASLMEAKTKEGWKDTFDSILNTTY